MTILVYCVAVVIHLNLINKLITMKQQPITWSSKLVEVSKIKGTPTNYKIKSDLGKERLQTSLKAFGLAGNVVCNSDLTLVDGNSRLEDAKEKGLKKIWVSVPSRKLSPREFLEFSALFDFAKAGEVDMERIEKDLGSKEEFFEKWGLEVPMHLLEGMGKGAAVVAGKAKKGEVLDSEAPKIADIKMVQLFFNSQQEKEFRVIEEKLAKKFKTDNVTDTVFKALKSIK